MQDLIILVAGALLLLFGALFFFKDKLGTLLEGLTGGGNQPAEPEKP